MGPRITKYFKYLRQKVRKSEKKSLSEDIITYATYANDANFVTLLFTSSKDAEN